MTDDAWRAEIGGKGAMWEAVGTLQSDFLIEQGLRPKHYLLDVGCGSLRGGVHFIPYLDHGHYYGIDKQGWLIDAGMLIELNEKEYHRVGGVAITETFDIPEDWPDFDYAIAQSLFTHLPPDKIHQCLENVCSKLSRNGKFYATFFDSGDNDHYQMPITFPAGIKTFPDRDPWYHEAGFLMGMAHDLGLKAEKVESFEGRHPRDQSMMVFYKIL